MTVTWQLVALGAAVGAPCRYLLDAAVSARAGRHRPWGTLVVNLLGSALAGLLAGAAAGRGVDPRTLSLLAVGALGAFTTASTYALEVVELAAAGRVRDAAGAVALTVGLGTALAWGGYLLGRLA